MSDAEEMGVGNWNWELEIGEDWARLWDASQMGLRDSASPVHFW